jgi:NADH oxidase (H2O2-forming)
MRKAGSRLDIAIIGNGIAGNSALWAIRNSGKNVRVALFSQEDYPLYSACAFYRYLAGEVQLQKLFLKKLDSYAQESVMTFLGKKVSHVDLRTREVMVEDTAIQFDHLVLATGSKPIFPPIRGIERRGVFALKTLDDAKSIDRYPAKGVVVLGSGPIGIECAIGLRKKGLEVTVVEILDRILPRLFDKKPSLMCRGILEEHGIQVKTEEKVLEILGGEGVTGVGTNKAEIPCDMVIMGVGLSPCTELAKAMGVSIGEFGGIQTNEAMLTNIEGVYACGDCIESRDIVTQENGLNFLWMNAKKQGWVAGYNCAGERKKFVGSYSSTILEIFGLYAMSAGKTATQLESRADLEVIEGMSDHGYYRLIVSGNHLVGIQLIDKIENAGMLFSKMLRKDELPDLVRTACDAEWLSMKPWNSWIRKYIAPGLGSTKK